MDTTTGRQAKFDSALNLLDELGLVLFDISGAEPEQLDALVRRGLRAVDEAEALLHDVRNAEPKRRPLVDRLLRRRP